MRLNIRQVTVGNRHAEAGDPAKVIAYYDWLIANPDLDLPAIEVRPKPNGTYRVFDGRHRFLAYVLAEREEIPAQVAIAHSDVALRWEAEYKRGRYAHEPPVDFVWDVVDAVRDAQLERDDALYIGCGNGRNYIPLAEAGLTLVGLDVSRTAIDQLTSRYPPACGRLIHGTVRDLPSGARYSTVIAIQVLQHGSRAEAHAHLRACVDRVAPGGLFCIRVNATGTELEYRHEVIESAEDGSFTASYVDGPKTGLLVHFFSQLELTRLLRDLEPVLPLRRARTERLPPAAGHWDQWEGIWRARSQVSDTTAQASRSRSSGSTSSGSG